MSAVVLGVFQVRYAWTFIMQPIRQLQWTTTKATAENLILSLLKNNRVQEGLTEK